MFENAMNSSKDYFKVPKEKTELVSRINHPAHYNRGALECIDVIEDWKLGFNLGSVLKYLCRSEHKGAEIEDLKKAQWYLKREIEKREKEINGTKAGDGL